MDYLNKKTVKNMDITGKKVFLRCDFNVPLDSNGNIINTKRIDESLETIKYLLEHQCKVILCSHLGKPKGKYSSKLSLSPVADYLSKVLNTEVKLALDVVGESAAITIQSLGSGEICMLENVRFEPGEELNDPEFAKKLASFADIYINDAFGTCHRAHASTAGIADYIPSACGFLVEKEIIAMSKVLDNPKRPLVAILGGAKVSDKINIIDFLLDKVDVLVIGGGMSYTFTNALGYSVGDSLCESDKISFVRDMMAKAKSNDVRIVLPVDIKVANEYSENAEIQVVGADRIPEGWMGLDIGPQTSKVFEEVILSAGTIIWNGPMGVYEWDNFKQGTFSVAKAIADSDAVSIIGGGDSAAAVENFGFKDRVTHVSTGGGASLKFLEGKSLPGLEALDNK